MEVLSPARAGATNAGLAMTPSATAATTAAAGSAARTLLRMEGLAVMALAIAAYANWGAGWMVFAGFFLVPDLSMLGYSWGPRVGAAAYNAGHSYLGPIALMAVGAFAALPLSTALALIWIAHIGFDRALGYGLKSSRGFRYTHLGTIGRPDAW